MKRDVRRLDRPHAKLREVKVCMISLGCPKNLVDSEIILGRVGDEGLAITARPEDADVIVVNTCGFINRAKEESIQTILEMCDLKGRSERPKKVVVTGCLGQRYGMDLRAEVPEVDAIIGLGEYNDIGATIRELADGVKPVKILRVSDPNKACSAEVGRFRLTPPHYAYVKISDGCDNPCTFCAIPAIRGSFRSKPIPTILEEVEELVACGAKEILLISQDTTSYGVDLTGEFQLPDLLERLNAVQGIEWIRVLYTYPSFLTDAMIDAVASLEKVVKYIDLPLQHIADRVLRRMGRRMNEAKTRRLLEKLRGRIPGLYLRTTFIVGFPGEDEKEFKILRNFVHEFGFERLGVFSYSAEEGTPAASFPDQVPPQVRARRVEEIMLTQQENAFRQNQARRGEIVRVLVDGELTSGKVLRTRSHGEAPEIDPYIFLEPESWDGRQPPRGSDQSPGQHAAPEPGDFVVVRITGSRGYDLLAIPVEPATSKSPSCNASNL